MLEQSIIVVNSQQNSSNTLHSESEHFAITCDVNGVDIIKSPTIESMSGKSFDDFDMQDVDIDVDLNNSNSCSKIFVHNMNESDEDDYDDGDDNNDECNTNHTNTNTTNTNNQIRNNKNHTYDRIEQKFERLSSQLDIDYDQSNNSQCQRDFDMAMTQINTDEISNLQRDFSKISWDDSVSATTADLGALTPDNDIQDIPKGDLL